MVRQVDHDHNTELHVGPLFEVHNLLASYQYKQGCDQSFLWRLLHMQTLQSLQALL